MEVRYRLQVSRMKFVTIRAVGGYWNAISRIGDPVRYACANLEGLYPEGEPA